MSDRAQDTEAIRAALSALADAATAGATAAYPAGSPPEFSALMAKTNAAYSDGLAALDRLVARLEAAEQALGRIAANAESWHGYLPPDNAPGAGHVRALGVIATWARAALAAAAPGETTDSQ